MFTIGRRLAEERDRLGYSQKALASRLLRTVRTQIKYEQGLTFPDAAYLFFLNQLGADIYYIVTGKRSANELEINEQAVLKAFRAMSQDGQDGILRMLVGADDFDSLAAFVGSPRQGEDGGSAGTVSNISGKAQVIVGGSNNVQVGAVRKPAKRKAKRDGE